MKILRGLLLAACLIFGSQPMIAANKKHETALKSTFVLYGRSELRHQNHHALCSVFAYKKAEDGYFLITAGHCFTGDDVPSDVQYFVADGQVTDTPNLQPVEVLNYIDDGKMDVAELHLKTTKQYAVLELDSKLTQIDDKVFFVGYPEIIAQTVQTGRVSSAPLESVGNPNEPCDICVGRILVQFGGGPGASGSPVISERTGKVVGIVEGHVFENGVVVVPTPLIQGYYAKAGHAVKAESKNE
jgi:S1-C subfamily serine protease